jgi:hypothetical protein
MNLLLLWASGGQSHWGHSDSLVEHTLELSYPKAKWSCLFTHLLLSVSGWRFFQSHLFLICSLLELHRCSAWPPCAMNKSNEGKGTQVSTVNVCSSKCVSIRVVLASSLTITYPFCRDTSLRKLSDQVPKPFQVFTGERGKVRHPSPPPTWDIIWNHRVKVHPGDFSRCFH